MLVKLLKSITYVEKEINDMEETLKKFSFDFLNAERRSERYHFLKTLYNKRKL